MLNILWKNNFLRFCKDTGKVTSLALLEITTKLIHFLSAEKKIPTLLIELQTNKNIKESFSVRKHFVLKLKKSS